MSKCVSVTSCSSASASASASDLDFINTCFWSRRRRPARGRRRLGRGGGGKSACGIGGEEGRTGGSGWVCFCLFFFSFPPCAGGARSASSSAFLPDPPPFWTPDISLLRLCCSSSFLSVSCQDFFLPPRSRVSSIRRLEIAEQASLPLLPPPKAQHFANLAFPPLLLAWQKRRRSSNLHSSEANGKRRREAENEIFPIPHVLIWRPQKKKAQASSSSSATRSLSWPISSGRKQGSLAGRRDCLPACMPQRGLPATTTTTYRSPSSLPDLGKKVQDAHLEFAEIKA